jgi:hypothetical protein
MSTVPVILKSRQSGLTHALQQLKETKMKEIFLKPGQRYLVTTPEKAVLDLRYSPYVNKDGVIVATFVGPWAQSLSSAAINESWPDQKYIERRIRFEERSGENHLCTTSLPIKPYSAGFLEILDQVVAPKGKVNDREDGYTDGIFYVVYPPGSGFYDKTGDLDLIQAFVREIDYPGIEVKLEMHQSVYDKNVLVVVTISGDWMGLDFYPAYQKAGEQLSDFYSSEVERMQAKLDLALGKKKEFDQCHPFTSYKG